MVGNDVDVGVVAVDKAHLAVGTDRRNGNVRVDRAGCEVHVRGGRRLNPVGGNEEPVAGTSGSHGGEIHQGGVTGRSGYSEADTLSGADAATAETNSSVQCSNRSARRCGQDEGDALDGSQMIGHDVDGAVVAVDEADL